MTSAVKRLINVRLPRDETFDR